MEKIFEQDLNEYQKARWDEASQARKVLGLSAVEATGLLFLVWQKEWLLAHLAATLKAARQFAAPETRDAGLERLRVLSARLKPLLPPEPEKK